MLKVDVPGYGQLRLRYLVLDYNGTLAFDGDLLGGVAERVERLAKALEIHILTADAHGNCAAKVASLPASLHVIGAGPEDESKLAHVKTLGCEECVAVGNGRNDRLMLEAAVLGICVMGPECCATAAASSADILAPSILTGLDLLLDPARLSATLRS